MAGAKPGLSKGFTYDKRNQVTCELCDRVFKNMQGLKGHQRFYHGLYEGEMISEPSSLPLEGGNSSPLTHEEGQPGAGATPTRVAPPASLREMELDIKRMELEERRDNLNNRRTNRTRFPDMGEIAGAGELTPSMKEQLQGRMFNTPPTEPKKSVVEQVIELMSSPAAPVIIAGIKGALGVDQGGGIENLLKLSGLNLVDILKGIGGGQVLPQELSIGGVVIPAGTPVAVLPYLASAGKQDAMVETANRWLKELSPLLAEKAQQMHEARTTGNGGGGPPTKRKPGQQPRQETGPDFVDYPCPKCGMPQTLDITTTKPGDKFDFICKACGYEEKDIEAYIPEPETKKRKPRIQKAHLTEDSGLPDAVECGKCGQLLKVPPDGQAGQFLDCPICGTQTPIMSDKPIPPGPALEPATEEVRRE